MHLQQFKGMQSSKQGQLFSLGNVCERGTICRQQEVNKEVPSLSKMVKRGLDLWAEPQNFVDPKSSCICGLHGLFPRVV